MINCSLCRVFQFILLFFSSVLIQAISNEELREVYNITIDDITKTVQLPQDSTVTQSMEPVIRIFHPQTREKLYLAGKRIDAGYYINVDDKLYEIVNPKLVTPESAFLACNQLEKQQNDALHVANKELQLQLTQTKARYKKLGAELCKQQEKEEMLQRAVCRHEVEIDHKKHQWQIQEQDLQADLAMVTAALDKSEKQLVSQEEKQKEVKTLLKQLEEELRHERSQHLKTERSLNAELEETRNQAVKTEKKLRSLFAEKLKSEKKEYIQKLTVEEHRSSQLKGELSRVKAKPSTVDKFTQTEENDPVSYGYDSASCQSLIDYSFSQAATKEAGQTESAGNKRKKKKKRSVKNKAHGEASGVSVMVAEPRKVRELPEKYAKINRMIFSSFDSVAKKTSRSYRRGDPPHTHNEGRVSVILTTLLSAPVEDNIYLETIPVDMMELLMDNYGRLRERGWRPRMEKTIGQIIELVKRYPHAHIVDSPLDILDQAFVTSTLLPSTIEEDDQAIILIKLLRIHWSEFSVTLSKLVPENVASDEDLKAALQGLLYSLMVHDINWIEKILPLFSGTEISDLFGGCCYGYDEKTAEDYGDAELARSLYSFVIYIKRVMDYQIKRVVSGEIWQAIDRQRLLSVIAHIERLLDDADNHRECFEKGDRVFVEKMGTRCLVSAVYPYEITLPKTWEAMLTIGSQVPVDPQSEFTAGVEHVMTCYENSAAMRFGQ